MKRAEGERQSRGAWLRETAIILAVLAGVTLLIAGLDLDRRLADAVWNNGHWPGTGTWPWRQLYLWAPLPGLIMAGIGFVLFGLSWLERRFKHWRLPALFVVLGVILGPGLVVNTLFKDHWGRARPSELARYGGQHVFTQVWETGRAAPNSSFPSGHSAIAFSSFLPWFVWRQRRPALARLILGGGLLFGSLVGAARILQGGHFLSDVLWSGGIVYLCGSVLARVLLREDP